MVNFFIDLGPSQQKITEDNIRKMIALKPRRMKISVKFSDKYGLKSPSSRILIGLFGSLSRRSIVSGFAFGDSSARMDEKPKCEVLRR